MSSKKKRAYLRLITVGGVRVEQSSARSRGSSPPRKRGPMHRKKLLYGKNYPLPAKGINYRAPVLMIDSFPLPALLQRPLTDASIAGHITERVPTRKNVEETFHNRLIPLDYTSINGRTIPPVTKKVRPWTICPMSRVNTPTVFKKGFCQRLQAARIRLGLEQADVAAALGITANTYSKYESRTLMPHHLIPVACEVLEIDMAYLYGETLRRRKMAGGDLHAS